MDTKSVEAFVEEMLLDDTYGVEWTAEIDGKLYSISVDVAVILDEEEEREERELT